MSVNVYVKHFVASVCMYMFYIVDIVVVKYTIFIDYIYIIKIGIVKRIINNYTN